MVSLRRPWLWIACALLALVGRPGPLQAQQDPRLVWQTLETPHFRIHYYQGEREIAERVAEVAERVLARLAGPLGWTPSQVTQIVLRDSTDDANGDATPIPYNEIRLFVTAPDDISPLSEYDDWLTTLVTHEYAHILHTDHIGGLPAIVNAILGKIWAPNMIQPRWILEGLAVAQETRFTTGGRLRSSVWDMYMRADALADHLATLDQLSSGPLRWPHGNIWYLYGSFFAQYLVDRFGPEVLARLSAQYGSMAMPWQLSRAMQRETGFGWEELYPDFCDAMRARYQQQRRAIEARGREEGTPLTRQGESIHVPRFLPDGTLLYESSDGETHPMVRAIDPSGGAPRALEWLQGSSGFGTVGDRALIVSDVAPYRDIYFYHDLFRWTLQRDGQGRVTVGATERLTEGWRAQQPDVAPDGDHVAFTVNHRGTTSLVEMSLADRVPHPLFRPERFEQVYAPRYSPDGRWIAFSHWRRGGYRDILLYDRQARTHTAIAHDRALDASPVFSPDGRWLVYSSDRTGVMNLYAYELETRRLRQVTNVVLGAFEPAISPDGRTLVYVGYSHRGHDLYRMPFDPARWRDPDPAPDPRDRVSAAHDVPLAVPTRTHPYSPWPTLYPRSWMADYVTDGFGPQVGIRTQGEDALERHAWTLRVGVGLVRGDPGVDFSYVYRGLRPTLRMHAYRTVDAGSGYRVGRVSPVWALERYGGEAEVSIHYPGRFDSHTAWLAYEAQHVGALGGLPGFARNLDPNEAPPRLPFQGWTAGLRATWAWSRVQRYTYSVSNQEGFSTFVTMHVTDHVLGSDTGGADASVALAGFLPMPWGSARSRHVLALRLAGGLGVSDRGERAIFSVGGFPSFTVDDLVESLRLGLSAGNVALRGYAPFARVGSQFALFNLEYRLPIVRISRGASTLPVFIQRVYGTAFMDVGHASFGRFRLEDLAVGAGAEVFVDLVLGFVLPFTLRIGYAHGFMADGTDQTYWLLSSPF